MDTDVADRLMHVATGFSTWATRALGTSLLMLVLVVLMGALHLAANRHTVQVLPLPGPGVGDQMGTAVEVSRIIAAMADGAGAGFDTDAHLKQASAAALPAVSIPGTNLPLGSMIEFLEPTPLGAQDRVRVGLTNLAPGSYRLEIEVDGYSMSGRRVSADQKSTVDEAMLDGAERIFELLKPVGAAYYFATRSPDRSLQLVDRILHEPQFTADDRAAALRIWGIVLRDQADKDDHESQDVAREKLWSAYQLSPDGEQGANILMDIGYTYRIEQRWPEAERAFKRALDLAPSSKVAAIRHADALINYGKLEDAESAYWQVTNMDTSWAEPWRGLARVALFRGDVWTALAHYRSARRRSVSPSDRATVDRDVADLYHHLGCIDEAKALYRQAALIDTGSDGPGPLRPYRGVLETPADHPCILLATNPPPTT